MGLRPTLTGKSLSEEVAEVLEQRDILYRETANIIVDATHEPGQVISKFVRFWIKWRYVIWVGPILNVHPVNKEELCQQDPLILVKLEL